MTPIEKIRKAQEPFIMAEQAIIESENARRRLVHFVLHFIEALHPESYESYYEQVDAALMNQTITIVPTKYSQLRVYNQLTNKSMLLEDYINDILLHSNKQ